MVATNLFSETGNAQVVLRRVRLVLEVLELPGRLLRSYNVPRTGLRRLAHFVELVQFPQFGRERCEGLMQVC